MKEYKDFRFHNLLYDLMEWEPPENHDLWASAITHIRDVVKVIPGSSIDDRSKHLQELRRIYKRDPDGSKISDRKSVV